MGSCTSSNRHRRMILQRNQSSAEAFHQSSFIHRLSHLRNYSPYNLNALIDETLLMIRTVVDNDQEPPHAMFLVSRIANREDRWLDVICALIDRIPIDDPLGATVIALLLDECSLPSDEFVQQLIRRICANNRNRIKQLQTIIDDYIREKRVLNDSSTGANEQSSSLPAVPQRFENDLHRDRNMLVVLACLAEKLGKNKNEYFLSFFFYEINEKKNFFSFQVHRVNRC